MAKYTKRKDSNGRVLPDGISERNDGRYIYRYVKNGKPHYLYGKTLDEVKEKKHNLEMELNIGLDNRNLGKICLLKYYPNYLEVYKKGKIKEASYQNKIQYFEHYIKPYDIAYKPLNELSRAEIIKHFQFLADEKGLARSTIESIASSMSCAVEELIMSKALLINPFKDAMKYIEARPRKKIEALEKDEQDALIRFLKKENGFQHVHLPLIGVLLGTGMRVGEAMALCWEDIDFEKNYILIYKTMNYRERGNGVKEYYVTTPKTENSYRKIPMSKDVIELLKMQKQYQENMHIRQDVVIPEYNLRGKEIRSFSGFVFTTRLGYPYSDGIGSNLRRIVAAYNKEETELAKKENREPLLLPKIHAHMLRHTFCTRLVESQLKRGITDYQAIKALMGHSSIRTSIDVYTSVSKELQKSYAKEVEDILNLDLLGV